MNFPLCFLLILLLVSISFSHSSSPTTITELEDYGIQKVRKYSSIQENPSVVEGDDDQVKRKYLHEVHSGPNPISNSLPQRKWKTSLPNP
ncbi:hypothetical protein Pint_04860 [Pistacia integerrima]|uniref:Uncharacterized protein n=1 Tax=Pistacia integerrima TaxID=434235 RepID=A0ACC0Z1S9_9ROSI|nr:hypothetical protein Pint_04860 [Pistacia integerrima]